jgi:hypothetical protein
LEERNVINVANYPPETHSFILELMRLGGDQETRCVLITMVRRELTFN